MPNRGVDELRTPGQQPKPKRAYRSLPEEEPYAAPLTLVGPGSAAQGDPAALPAPIVLEPAAEAATGGQAAERRTRSRCSNTHVSRSRA